MKETVIFLDMDGVLFNFNWSACEVHRVDYEEFNRTHKRGEWDIRQTFSTLLGLPRRMTMDEFWEPINRDSYRFWSELETTPWNFQLLHRFEPRLSSAPETYLLTSPPWCPQGVAGKIDSVRMLDRPYYDHRVIPTIHKHLFAGPNRILIDDSEDNIKRFREFGGTGIVFPTIGNSLHEMSADPLPYVFEELERCI